MSLKTRIKSPLCKGKCKIIMLVDDNPIDHFINQKILSSSAIGEKLIFCDSSHEAINYLKNCLAVEIPDVIFLDINMPILNGYGFLSLFQDLPTIIKEFCKIVILSSSNDMKDVLLLNSNPFVAAYLIKPLKKEDVVELFDI